MARRTLSIRVDPVLWHHLARIAADLETRMPGFRLSVSDAARHALLEGIAVLERRATNRKRRRR